MAFENSRENMLSHESEEYINSRPDWVVGKIPDLKDYLKLSVDNFEEAYTLAKFGQQIVSAAFPSYKGEPLKLYFTQALLIGAGLLDREQADKLGLNFEKYRSVLMITPSRYGKSYLNAILVICQAALKGLEVRIGGATMDKAGIVQSKVTELLPYASRAIQEGLVVVSGKDNVTKKIQRMSTQVSKDSLKWRNGGSIMMFATNESKKNADVAAAGAVGIGGDFQVHDEIQLMSPTGFRTASRFMMENSNTKRFCVGNPSINGHFKDLYDDPNTFVVHMNDITAIIEERMTRHGFELTGMPTYSPEYRSYILCLFPDGQSGSRFFSTLPSESHSEGLEKPEKQFYFIGIDSAYNGGDSLIATLLSVNIQKDGQMYVVCEKQIDYKKKYPEWKKGTTTHIALDILKLWEDYDIKYGAIDIGQGIHIYEEIFRLRDDINMEPINFGSKPTDWRMEMSYAAQNASNKRAEMHLDVKDLCEKKMLYLDTSCYEDIVRQMRELNLGAPTASGKLRIELKEALKRRIGRSPDNLDSLCLAVHAAALSGALDGNSFSEDDADVFMEVI